MGHNGRMSLDSSGKKRDLCSEKVFSALFDEETSCFPGLYYHSSAKGLPAVLPHIAVP